jgi:hypothetical protein
MTHTHCVTSVIPAKAGISLFFCRMGRREIPAFAGMTQGIAMHVWLKAHPDHPSRAVNAVSVDVESAPDGFTLWYAIEGEIGDILIPSPTHSRRVDSLWKSTCFEAFFRKPGASDYLEFNFSPSAEWAAYMFDAYRAGMRPFDIVHAPIISHIEQSFMLDIHVTLPIDPQHWLAAFSAVIEERNGTRSYWALAHPPGEPDFHHPDCFAFELPAGKAP